MADLEIAGGGGCWVRTIGRAAAAGRPEARSAGGRPGGGFGRGSPSTPSRKGVRGYHPRENFEILYRKRCILVHYKWLLQCYFAFKNPWWIISWHQPVRLKKYLVANFLKTFLRNSWSISLIKITTQMNERWRIHWKNCQNVIQYKSFPIAKL